MEKTKKRFWPILLLAVYLAVNMALILHHENWRDEAQAWQIAGLLDLKGPFAQLKYEGHPCLWYLILMPFAKLHAPFGSMNGISLVLMAVAAWLVLTRAPFSMPVRVLTVFSGFFLYYYPVISRSYALVPPLLALLALCYSRRMEKPLPYGILLALLTQTHIYMLGLSAALSFFWLLEILREMPLKKPENRVRLCAVFLNLASGLFLIWELFGSTDRNTGVNIHISSTLSSNLHRMSVASQWASGFAVGGGISDETWKILVFVIALCFLLLLLWSWKETLILAAAVGSQVLMFTYVYLPSEQKAMLLVHELIFILWLILKKKKASGEREETDWRRKGNRAAAVGFQALLAVLCLLSVDGHRGAMESDWKEPYSAGKDAAAYIEKEIPQEALLVTAGDVPAYAVAAYAPDRTLWYPLTEAPITFSVWNESREETIGYEEMLERIRSHYPEVQSFWLLTGGQNNIEGLEEALADTVPVFREDALISEESVRIYDISGF